MKTKAIGNFFLRLFVLFLIISSCSLKRNVPNNQEPQPSRCAFIFRPDQFFIYLNEETILHLSVSSVKLTDVMVKLTNGKVISNEMGVCVVMVTEGTSTMISLSDATTGQLYLERLFNVIERLE